VSARSGKVILGLVVLSAFTATILGLATLASRRSPPRQSGEPSQSPSEQAPFGLDCPPGDLIADVEREILPLENGPSSPRAALSAGLENEEGLSAATPQEDPKNTTGTEVEFVFEDNGATIGWATVEKLEGSWYVTSYVACSSAQ
jgi:hypothetical protein